VKAAIYVPHGAIPDKRGFAPAIVAWNHARRLKTVSPVIVSAREDYPGAHEIVDGIPVYRVGEGRLYRRVFRKMTRLDPYPLHRRAAKLVRRESPDLFHAHQLEFPVAEFHGALGRKIPVIVHAHVTAARFEEKRGIADRYLAVSRHVRDRLVAEKNFPPEKVEVLSNGVDTQLFSPPQAGERETLRWSRRVPPEAVVVAFVGRMQEVKGFHVFLKTVERALQNFKSLYAIAVGPEPEDSHREATYEMRREIRRKLRAGGAYMEYPALPHAELAGILKMTDIVLVPSLSEPQGMVMLESMACGCVTISSNREGIKESVEHGRTGFLLDRPENSDEVLAQLEDVIQRLGSLGALRHAAREVAETRFDWNVVTARLEKIYLDLIARAHAA
jgi:glycosyltransferase involved in cell wall biosynthesis